MFDSYICALDIGSSKCAACVAVVKRKRVTDIFFESIPSKGIKNGIIVDSTSLIDTVSKLLKSLRAHSGIKIKFINVNISGEDVVTRHSRAIVPLAERGNKVITASDVQNANEQARILGSSLNEEIVHTVPCAYAIDSKSNIINPIGLYSHKLEVDLYLICGRVASIQSLSRAIHQAGYEIKNLFFSGLATSKLIFNKELKEANIVFCDIGSDTTELLLFSSGLLKDIQILSFGGYDLTVRLQEALKIPFELAEEIKRSHGIIADPAEIGEDKEILVKKSDLYKPIKQRLVSEIIASAATSICSYIKEAVENKIPNYEVNHFVVAGRTVLLEGFIETLENALSIPVRLSCVSHPQIAPFIKEDDKLSGMKYLTYLTSLGMICEALEENTLGFLPMASPLTSNIITKTFSRAREIYQEYF
ncbi:MAG: cell division protein FtsA [Candidatus Omnitrophota bacterium]